MFYVKIKSDQFSAMLRQTRIRCAGTWRRLERKARLRLGGISELLVSIICFVVHAVPFKWLMHVICWQFCPALSDSWCWEERLMAGHMSTTTWSRVATTLELNSHEHPAQVKADRCVKCDQPIEELQKQSVVHIRKEHHEEEETIVQDPSRGGKWSIQGIICPTRNKQTCICNWHSL